MAEPNQSLDADPFTRDRESRIGAAAIVGLSTAKQFLEYQTSMLRLWANNCELAVRNCEKGLEAIGTATKQQSRQ
jgi:hypothetical protein